MQRCPGKRSGSWFRVGVSFLILSLLDFLGLAQGWGTFPFFPSANCFGECLGVGSGVRARECDTARACVSPGRWRAFCSGSTSYHLTVANDDYGEGWR